jgi:CDP-diacylglycerol---glycerol-3-phosphate 3-phosphatidyltransferase
VERWLPLALPPLRFFPAHGCGCSPPHATGGTLLIGSRIGHSLDPLLLHIYRRLFLGKRPTPNVLTICGLLVSLAAAYAAAFHNMLLVAGLLLLLAGFFDLMDGAVARKTLMVTRFGGFLDSVLDRYSDLLVMLGISAYFLRVDDPLFCIATSFAAVGVAIIPYARARAEAASIECRNGILERPERIVLLVVGLLFGDITLKVVVVILAVLTHVTVMQRIWFVRKQSAEGVEA